MSIERLRALEKKWREMANDRANAEWVTLVNCANELRDLIAELGQEVGAVAYIVPVARVTSDGSYEDGPPQLCFADEADDYVRRVGAPLYTSPAHTSEARDGALGDLYDAASKGFRISETCGPDKKYWHVCKFQTLAELHAYEDAWRAAMTQVRDERAKA